jgi:hypothetical protein
VVYQNPYPAFEDRDKQKNAVGFFRPIEFVLEECRDGCFMDLFIDFASGDKTALDGRHPLHQLVEGRQQNGKEA